MVTNMTRLITHVAGLDEGASRDDVEAQIQDRFGVSYDTFEDIARTLLGYSALLRDPDTDLLTHVFGYDEGEGMYSLAELIAEVQYEDPSE